VDNKAPKPNDRPWLSPSLTVANIENSLKYYNDTFGFSIGESFSDESGEMVFGNLLYKDQIIMMLVKENAFGANVATPAHSNHDPAIGLYVFCDDVDELYSKASKSNANIIAKPQDMFWGDRTMSIKDIDGHQWNFATRLKNFEFKPETATV